MDAARDRRLALAGSAWGMGGGLVLLVLAWSGGDPGSAGIARLVALGAALVGPFAVAVSAMRLASPGARAAVWRGVGIYAALASLLSLAGVTLILLPGAILLIVAASRVPGVSPSGRGGRMAITAGLVIGGIGSLAAMLALSRSRCWKLLSSGRWVEIPYATTLSGGGGVRAISCDSGVTTLMGAAVAVLIWTGIGLLVLRHGRGSERGRTAAAVRV